MPSKTALMAVFLVLSIFNLLVGYAETHAEVKGESSCAQDAGPSLLQLRTQSSLFNAPKEEPLAIIPAPKSVLRKKGVLEIPRITVDAPAALVRTLEEFIGPTVTSEDAFFQLRLKDVKLGEEGCVLNVSDRVVIEAASEHGLFHGVMTVRQLLQKDSNSNDLNGSRWKIPRVEIRDEPALHWRGLMLDVSRHFFYPADVKHLLRTMALFKMNHFHWHLTDDQGWRFPVAKYPNLIRLGAFRRASPLGHTDRTDNTPYNHSYTELEIEDVISFAESLYIQVVPEFDLPGHSQAAIASYPELGNFDSSEHWEPQVATSFGALPYTLSPSEKSVNFTKDVLSEMARLFEKSSYIHIGGDEVSTSQWSKSPVALEVARENNVGLSHLEGMMLEKASNHLHDLHRNAVVWDDALDSANSLPQGTVVMIWREFVGLGKQGDKAAARGHSVVLAPSEHAYFDRWQDQKHAEFDAICCFTPLSRVYDTPIRAGRANVLGIQGQLWSEYIRQGARNLDYMAWPRGCALAEVAWSGEQRPGFQDFRERLQKRTQDFKAFDIYLGEI
ncbi:unnamed protein product [Cladocopium goreaui]|uniref:beta-N-acetylhexosaminidase n=1 Tax=Cladocopium goreaui TaxID=2562237 RepID=A0A9P1CHJ1_9DINO|nr:unnamed protein product [Cladocopium goreaui]